MLTRVNIDEAFRDKLGVDFQRYTILGACNPRLAHEALSADPDVGTILPCNVCVEETQVGSRVHIADPAAMMIRETTDMMGSPLLVNSKR